MVKPSQFNVAKCLTLVHTGGGGAAGGEWGVWEELKESGPPPPPQVLLDSGNRFCLMLAVGCQTCLAVLQETGIGQGTRGRGHLAFLQPIEPVPNRQKK